MSNAHHAGRLLLQCMSLAVCIQISLPQLCGAEVLSLASTLEQAASASYDLRLARIKAFQLRSDIRGARADYYPTLQASASTEYDKGLKNSPQQVFSVGNTTFNALTRCQVIGTLQSS